MSELTTRLRLPRPTGGDPADVPADFDALTRRLDAVALGYEMGPLGSRPPTVPDGGRFYFATDIGTLYYDKAGAWVAVPTWGRGVRPAAGVAGRIWEESSTGVIYWDTGERWLPVVSSAGVRAQVFGTIHNPIVYSSYTLMPEMTVSGTFSGRPVQLQFEGLIRGPSAVGEVGGIQFVRNGTVINRSLKHTPMETVSSDSFRTWSASFLDLNPPGGLYTYQVYWGGANFTLMQGYTAERHFSVVELPS